MKTLWFLVLLLVSYSSFSQGKLLLVGGGAEGSWSDPAYQWALESAENKEVAIISYFDESQSLPNYFHQLGADTAVNIKINSTELAQKDSIYNLLMSFDFLFFKGGDQSNYYRTYKNTRVTDAMNDKFEQGGVLGGTSAGLAILTGVIYSASGSSVYPEQGLLNLNDEDITLHQDFAQVLPGFLGDTHFVERGRQFRLIAFLARWYKDTGQLINGIGVDDKTAFCIEGNLVGTCIGTGAVSLYLPDEFHFTDNQFSMDSLHSVQLLDSMQYDLSINQLINDYDTEINSSTPSESANYTLFLSGSGQLNQNEQFFNDFNQSGEDLDSVLLITSNQSNVLAIKDHLNAQVVSILIPSDESNSVDSAGLRNNIRRSKKILFYKCSNTATMDFVREGETGKLLQDHLRRNGIVTGFIGQTSLLAGSWFVTNNLTDNYASYENQLNFAEGLNLLKTTTIMSNSIDLSTSDYYENNTSSVLYALAKYRLKYGLYINQGSFIKIEPQNNDVLMTQYGNFPSISITNDASYGGFSESRNVIGADKLTYEVHLDGETKKIGTPVIGEDPVYSMEEENLFTPLTIQDLTISSFPNPASESIRIKGWYDFEYKIFDSKAQLIKQGSSKETINIKDLNSGIYFVLLNKNNIIFRFKTVKE